MATVKPHKIVLKGDPIYKELPLEALDVYGVGAIIPGMLCERTSTNTVQAHASAAGQASAIFAVENAIFEGRDIDTAYDSDGEAVLLAYCRPGDEVYAWLAAGTGQVSVIGGLLGSNGDGFLDVGTVNPIVRALEAIDNDPGTDGAAVRVRVEVL